MTETLKELHHRFANADFSDDDLREALEREVRNFANTHPDELEKFFQLFPIGKENNLFEAIAAVLDDAQTHRGPLVSQFRRMVDAAAGPQNDDLSFSAIQAFEMLKDDETRAACYDYLKSKDESDSVLQRILVAQTLPSFHNSLSKTDRILYQKLTSDSNWKVRVLARNAINDFDGLPLDSGLRLFDKIRAKVQSRYL